MAHQAKMEVVEVAEVVEVGHLVFFGMQRLLFQAKLEEGAVAAAAEVGDPTKHWRSGQAKVEGEAADLAFLQCGHSGLAKAASLAVVEAVIHPFGRPRGRQELAQTAKFLQTLASFLA